MDYSGEAVIASRRSSVYSQSARLLRVAQAWQANGGQSARNDVGEGKTAGITTGGSRSLFYTSSGHTGGLPRAIMFAYARRPALALISVAGGCGLPCVNVSIIIPALNEADRIGTAIERAWSAGADQVIVVDGGSDDATCHNAAELQCLLLNSQPGRAMQQNAGAQQATGEVLLFLHADNWLAEGTVEQVRELLSDTAVQHGAFRQSIQAAGVRYRLLEWGNGWRLRWRGLPYGDQGIFVRRATFFAADCFPEVPLMEDLILMRDLRASSWPRLLAGPIRVDPRRWQRHGVLRQTLRNWWLVRSYDRGVSLDRLASCYRRHDR